MRSSKAQFNAQRRQVGLEQRAWRNRRVPTRSEALLWEELRGGKLGVRFRRQVPVCGRYIADFLAPTVRLVVEVDGGYHATCQRRDERRDAVLAAAGYRVLRLNAAMVMEQLPQAVALIRAALCQSH